MKKVMKRVLSAVLILVMSMLLLAGCGSSSKDKNNGTSSDNANNNATATNNATNTATATDNATNNGTSSNNANNNATATNNATNNAANTNNANSMSLKGAKPGTYTATAQGYASKVKVTLTIAKDGTISDIKADASGETAELGGKAAPQICKEVKDKQSLSVDAVSGATVTSNAVITALSDAFSQAGVDLGKSK